MCLFMFVSKVVTFKFSAGKLLTCTFLQKMTFYIVVNGPIFYRNKKFSHWLFRIYNDNLRKKRNNPKYYTFYFGGTLSLGQFVTGAVCLSAICPGALFLGAICREPEYYNEAKYYNLSIVMSKKFWVKNESW